VSGAGRWVVDGLVESIADFDRTEGLDKRLYLVRQEAANRDSMDEFPGDQYIATGTHQIERPIHSLFAVVTFFPAPVPWAR
jgi:hypothetical protein